MPEGPFGGPRPLSASSQEIVVKFNEPVGLGVRSMEETFEKVGMDVDVKMESDGLFIITPFEEPITIRNLNRVQRALTAMDSVEHGRGTYSGVTIEMRCR
jgi:hypothetical protein